MLLPINLEEDVIVPMADVKGTDEAVIVTMDLPGIDTNDVDITIFDNILRVVAERTNEKESSESCYYKHSLKIRDPSVKTDILWVLPSGPSKFILR